MSAIDSDSRSLRIAVFEDDINVALLLRYNLEARAYSVRCFPEGQRAIDHLRVDTPDAVVLDWGLPGVSGIEVLRRMRACALLRFVPVVMLTARCLPEDRQRALDTGANAFLAKPFSVSEVIDTVQRLIGLVTAQKQMDPGGVMRSTFAPTPAPGASNGTPSDRTVRPRQGAL